MQVFVLLNKLYFVSEKKKIYSKVIIFFPGDVLRYVYSQDSEGIISSKKKSDAFSQVLTLSEADAEMPVRTLNVFRCQNNTLDCLSKIVDLSLL